MDEKMNDMSQPRRRRRRAIQEPAEEQSVPVQPEAPAQEENLPLKKDEPESLPTETYDEAYMGSYDDEDIEYADECDLRA